MLQLLHIENIAIIECADIEFRPGFNALTGETGAGKSIVIDSISAVLGQRTSRDLIRTGANVAFVSACFTDIPPRLGEDLGIAWESQKVWLPACVRSPFSLHRRGEKRASIVPVARLLIPTVRGIQIHARRISLPS